MHYKYIITGTAGKVASGFLYNIPKNDILAIYRNTKPEVDVNACKVDLSKWNGELSEDLSEYNVVLHCAAKAHIDSCEKDKPMKKAGQAWIDNVVATKKVAEFCKRHKMKMVFFSTECVFGDDKKIYTEEDRPNPKSWYGETKLLAENYVRRVPNHLIIRTVMLYGTYGNDIAAILSDKLDRGEEINAVVDQRIAFTYDEDLVKITLDAIKLDLQGTYHFSGEPVTPYDFAVKLAMAKGNNPALIKKTTLEKYFGNQASLRLRNSVLDSTKILAQTKFKPTSLDEGLKLTFSKND